jgi:hypothetical protein
MCQAPPPSQHEHASSEDQATDRRRLRLFDGSGSKLGASPQREYVLAKSGPRDLLGVVNITA